MHQSREELTQLSALIDLIYEGALEVSVWQELPRRIAEWMAAPVCTLFTPLHTPAAGGFMGSHNISASDVALWNTKYQPHDLWARRALERGLALSGQVMRDQDLVTEDEFVDSLIYREYFSSFDTGRLVSAIIFGTDDSANLTTICSCTRPLREAFTEDDAFKLKLIVPHLSRALGVMFRLRAADFKLASSLAALDLLTQGVVLFAGDGAVFHLNRRARAMCEQGEGLSLKAQAGRRDRLQAQRPGEQQQLDAAIRDALHPSPQAAPHFSTALQVGGPGVSKAYALNFSALPAGNEFGLGADAPRAIAFIGDMCARLEPDMKVMCERFGLTPAEWRVLRLAVDGGSVGELSETLRVSPNTTKSHLQRIYEKTGTANRAQLLRLVLSSSGAVMA